MKYEVQYSNEFSAKAGRIKGFYIIVVVYTDRMKYNDNKETIRIISSRYATKKEIKQYIDFNSRRGK